MGYGFVIALAILIGAVPARAAPAPVTVGGPFTLIAPDGTSVTDKSYADKWLLVYFGYTHCPNICPTALLEMATALRKLGLNADKLQGVFITVDPQRDTPEVMGDYAQSFDPRIIGLSGSAGQIAAVAKAYGAYFARNTTGPGPNDYEMDHSTYIYLMDPHGKFVRGFDTETSGDHVAEVVQKLMNEMAGKRSAAGIGR